MKTAILITGHPRTYQKTVDHLFKNCILQNSSDVYISVWSENEDGSSVDVDRLCAVYGALAASVSSSKEHENDREKFHRLHRIGDCFDTNIRAYLSLKTNGNKHIDRIRSQWYRVKCGMELIENTKKYDVVMRTRFDIRYNAPIHFDSVDCSSSRYYVPSLLESVRQDHFVYCGLTTPVMTDHWCYGSWESMMKYGCLYDNILPMYQNENIPICNAEEMFAYFMLTRIGTEHYINSVPYELVR